MGNSAGGEPIPQPAELEGGCRCCVHQRGAGCAQVNLGLDPKWRWPHEGRMEVREYGTVKVHICPRFLRKVDPWGV